MHVKVHYHHSPHRLLPQQPRGSARKVIEDAETRAKVEVRMVRATSRAHGQTVLQSQLSRKVGT